MSQSQKFSKIVLFAIMMFSLQSQAGGMEGGGGNSVVCHNPQGKIISAEIYDLFEGRALYGYLSKLETQDYKTQARAIAKKLLESSAEEFFVEETERILSDVRFLPSDAALIPVSDSDSIIKPANCDFVQAAIYQGNKRVYFDSNIWNLLDESNRAALISHEVIFAFMRAHDNAKNSLRARQYVAFMYSGQSLRKRWVPEEGEHYEVCATNYNDPMNSLNTPSTLFYTKVNSDGTWKISFRIFDGLSVLGLTEITSNPAHGYSWPISFHNSPDGKPGGYGVGLEEVLEFDVDEAFRVSGWFLDLDSNSNYISIQSAGKWENIYFSCQAYNF